MFLVVWSLELGGSALSDQWQAFDNREEAESLYDQLKGDSDVYTASLCIPIASTDYETPAGYLAKTQALAA